MRRDRHELETRSKELSAELLDLREKVDRYKAQQFDVKTTREYDAITFQLEDAQRRLHTNTEAVGRMGVELEQLKMDDEQMGLDLTEMEGELEEAEAALTEVLAGTEEEEKRLLTRREELVKQVQPFLFDDLQPRPSRKRWHCGSSDQERCLRRMLQCGSQTAGAGTSQRRETCCLRILRTYHRGRTYRHRSRWRAASRHV